MRLARVFAAVAAVAIVPVKGRGVPPSVQVRVIQCDRFTGDPDAGDCADEAVTTASSSGTVVLSLTLADPVYRIEPFGDPMTVYCPADRCRIFLAWTDTTGTAQAASLARLGQPRASLSFAAGA
jgi:hypothetical protein